MYAIVMAAGIPQPDDPLYAYSKGDPKALVDVAGRPMIQWVLDALGAATHVDEIIVVGLSAKSDLPSLKPVHYVSNQGRLLANVVAGIEKSLALDPKTGQVLLSTADIPALKPDMVDWFVDAAMQTRADLYYGVCPRPVMEKRFDAAKPAYLRMKDLEVCPAGLAIARVSLVRGSRLDTWEKLAQGGLSPLRLAAVLGVGLATRLGLARLTLEEATQAVSDRLGVRVRPIVWSAAEPSMDANTPDHVEILRRDLGRRSRVTKPSTRAKPAGRKAVQRTRKATKRTVARTAGQRSRRSSRSRPRRK